MNDEGEILWVIFCVCVKKEPREVSTEEQCRNENVLEIVGPSREFSSSRQENPRSPLILPNEECQEVPVLTTCFVM